MTRTDAPLRRGEKGVLWALLAFTLLAVAGYGYFGLHPERLVTPLAARFYGISFQFFAQIHILLAAVALGWVLVGRLGSRWLPARIGLAALSGVGRPARGDGGTAWFRPQNRSKTWRRSTWSAREPNRASGYSPRPSWKRRESSTPS